MIATWQRTGPREHRVMIDRRSDAVREMHERWRLVWWQSALQASPMLQYPAAQLGFGAVAGDLGR